MSVLYGFVLPPVFNTFYSEDKAAKRAARETGDLVELLIMESLERQMLIELSLKNGKVYIGYALEIEAQVLGESDAAIVPMMSGYRDNQTRKVKPTTNYARMYTKLNVKFRDLRDFRIVVPKSEIGSVRLVDINQYNLL